MGAFEPFFLFVVSRHRVRVQYLRVLDIVSLLAVNSPLFARGLWRLFVGDGAVLVRHGVASILAGEFGVFLLSNIETAQLLVTLFVFECTFPSSGHSMVTSKVCCFLCMVRNEWAFTEKRTRVLLHASTKVSHVHVPLDLCSIERQCSWCGERRGTPLRTGTVIPSDQLRKRRPCFALYSMPAETAADVVICLENRFASCTESVSPELRYNIFGKIF